MLLRRKHGRHAYQLVLSASERSRQTRRFQFGRYVDGSRKLSLLNVTPWPRRDEATLFSGHPFLELLEKGGHLGMVGSVASRPRLQLLSLAAMSVASLTGLLRGETFW